MLQNGARQAVETVDAPLCVDPRSELIWLKVIDDSSTGSNTPPRFKGVPARFRRVNRSGPSSGPERTGKRLLFSPSTINYKSPRLKSALPAQMIARALTACVAFAVATAPTFTARASSHPIAGRLAAPQQLNTRSFSQKYVFARNSTSSSHDYE